MPSLTVLVIGDRNDPATTLTERSIRAADYEDPIEILVTGDRSPGEAAAGAAGEYLLTIPAGAVLDPACPGLLVARMSDTVAVVLPEIRAQDGGLVPSGMHIEPSGVARPRARHSGIAHRAHHPVDVTAAPVMLARTTAFAAATFRRGRPSPFGPARIVVDLTGPDRDVVVEDRAVIYVRRDAEAPARRPGYELFSDGLISPGHPPDPAPEAVLWVAAQLPDRTRTGSDARHLEMIESLITTGVGVTVWAERGGDAGPAGRQLTTAGAHWETPLPSGRWNTTAATAPFHLLEELLGERRWVAVVVTEPRLVAPVAARAAALAKDAPVIADLGAVRFPAAHRDDGVDLSDPVVGSMLSQIAAAHAVVTVTAADAAVVGSDRPDRSVTVLSPLGEATAAGPKRDGDLLFVGDLLHHPNVQALEWWIEELAGLVHTGAGRPLRLRVVGNGSAIYRRTWSTRDKVDIAGHRPDLSAELNAARVLTVPLPYPTGTGHRIATALRAGVPVVASSAAAAVLPAHLSRLVAVGADGAELAGHITRLMTDDAHWDEACRRIGTAPAVTGADEWIGWLRKQRPPQADEPGPVSPRPGSRRGRRQRVRSS